MGRGWLEFHGDFKIGDHVKKQSRIDDISFKSGKSGNLCFVAVTHEFSVGGQLKLRERHDVVYREEVTAAPPLDPITDSMAAHRWQVDANSVMLFRYSALTFNGHRIHYDLPYSTNVEGHGGLLVHGWCIWSRPEKHCQLHIHQPCTGKITITHRQGERGKQSIEPGGQPLHAPTAHRTDPVSLLLVFLTGHAL